VEKEAQRVVTSDRPDLTSLGEGCAPLGLGIVIVPIPRPLAWAIESRPFGLQTQEFFASLKETRWNSATSKAPAEPDASFSSASAGGRLRRTPTYGRPRLSCSFASRKSLTASSIRIVWRFVSVPREPRLSSGIACSSSPQSRKWHTSSGVLLH
jgi:hypothetical protein